MRVGTAGPAETRRPARVRSPRDAVGVPGHQHCVAGVFAWTLLLRASPCGYPPRSEFRKELRRLVDEIENVAVGVLEPDGPELAHHVHVALARDIGQVV